jgi:hypothetical protein
MTPTAPTHALDRRVAAFPTPDNWRELLYTIIQTPGQSDPFLLQVYRLTFDLDVLKGPRTTSRWRPSPMTRVPRARRSGCSKRASRRTSSQTAAVKTHSAQLLESVKKKVAIDQASLSKIAADAASRQNRHQGRRARTCLLQLPAIRQGGRSFHQPASARAASRTRPMRVSSSASRNCMPARRTTRRRLLSSGQGRSEARASWRTLWQIRARTGIAPARKLEFPLGEPFHVNQGGRAHAFGHFENHGRRMARRI